MKASVAASILAFTATAFASPSYQAPTSFSSLTKRASIPIPASKGTQTLNKTMAVTGTFDGGLKTYGRGVSCTGQAEGGDSDAVFSLANGATLKNVIIGAGKLYSFSTTSYTNITQTRSRASTAKDLALWRTSGGPASARVSLLIPPLKTSHILTTTQMP